MVRFMTLVAGERRSLLMAGNNDEVHNVIHNAWQETSTLRRRQCYAVV